MGKHLRHLIFVEKYPKVLVMLSLKCSTKTICTTASCSEQDSKFSSSFVASEFKNLWQKKKILFFWNVSLLYFTSGENRTMCTDKYQIEPTSKCGARSSCCSVFAERRVVSSSLPAFLKSLLLKGLYVIFVLAPMSFYVTRVPVSCLRKLKLIWAPSLMYTTVKYKHILLPTANSYPPQN
jgi:hypothetical protein